MGKNSRPVATRSEHLPVGAGGALGGRFPYFAGSIATQPWWVASRRALITCMSKPSWRRNTSKSCVPMRNSVPQPLGQSPSNSNVIPARAESPIRPFPLPKKPESGRENGLAKPRRVGREPQASSTLGMGKNPSGKPRIHFGRRSQPRAHCHFSLWIGKPNRALPHGSMEGLSQTQVADTKLSEIPNLPP